MEIKDLRAKQGDVDLVVIVVEKTPARTFDKFGKQGRVCNAKVKDSTGTVTLTLWNEDIDKIGVGDKIKIIKGYVGEWQGELQLSAGKYGKIEVMEKGSGVQEPEVFSNVPKPSDDTNDDLEDDSDDVEEEFFD